MSNARSENALSHPSVDRSAPGPDQGVASTPSWLPWAWFPVALFVVHRAALMAIGSLGLRMVPTYFTSVPPESPMALGLRSLCRWDCGMYFQLASGGYTSISQSSIFPLYPLLARALAAATGMTVVNALLVVSNAAGLAALVVVYRVFWRLGGMRAARWGLTLFTAYPFAYFHAAGYAETLAIALAAAAILLALNGRHITAGAVLALGCLARHIDLLAVPSLLVIAAQQRGLRPRALLWDRRALGLLLPPLAIVAYAAFCRARFGHPLAFALSRGHTEYGANAFWAARSWWSVAEAFRGGRLDTEPVLASYVVWAMIPTAGAVALLGRRAWRSLAPFALLLMALYLGASLMGLGRFSASCWPAFLPLGAWLARHPTVAGYALIPLALAQGFYFFLWSHWFGIW